ncbi:MAG: hypothetical protein A2806_03160 [Candidatus Terrybacteria bacterium RIFCSPHIGHO2_01_FULL_48_17]|uniref:t-SNARE coiled-coil homology domain-containing protein n=1 Tax=Candidatus Terrybacteria bacterium RIFCSPHIGHO2_01_FULL_48_17 TaxID=1802362 RepID=A0A1G2PIX1_9BACT|nr:MAG: hypothetical protein A2806_03160 [Candidatus Terrybacteria bacterium RIFCSPHIGHO2_01_FULL_48_17]
MERLSGNGLDQVERFTDNGHMGDSATKQDIEQLGQRIERKIDAIDEKVDVLDKMVGTIDEKIDALAGSVQREFLRIDERFQKIEERLAEHNRNFQSIATILERIELRLSQMAYDIDIKELQKRVARLEERAGLNQ